MMLFGILRIMARDAGLIKTAPHHEYECQYDDERKLFHDLLRSPMTLAQGAAIMNAYRKKLKVCQTSVHAATLRYKFQNKQGNDTSGYKTLARVVPE